MNQNVIHGSDLNNSFNDPNDVGWDSKQQPAHQPSPSTPPPRKPIVFHGSDRGCPQVQDDYCPWRDSK